MKNPSFGELRSLCQINQVCKEENQRRNITFSNFAMLCEIFPSLAKYQKEYKLQDREQDFGEWISHPIRNFATLAKYQKEYKLQDREQDFGEWISHPIRNFATLANLRKMNFATSYETKAEENQFRTLCEISQALRNLLM